MSNAQFITINSTASTGALPALTRSQLLVTREAVTGYTADPITGLFKFAATDQAGFAAANAASLGLQNTMAKTFGQSYAYPYVYVLSTQGAALTAAMLTKANTNVRAWSLIIPVDRYDGSPNLAAFIVDCVTISGWGVRANRKVCLMTFSMANDAALPAELTLGGSLNSDAGFITIVSDSKSAISAQTVYDNIWAAISSYCINGPFISRSWGSLSDAHDFLLISSDGYDVTTRNAVANNSLTQYNGAKDRAGSRFAYDTTMNSPVNPPLTPQLETILAEDYIDDYVYVYVHNALQAAGQSGLTNDDKGIQTLLALVSSALNDCFALNLILAKPDKSGDFSCWALTAAQVTQIAPTWQSTGQWPAGVVSAKVKPFGAAHYAIMNFTYP